MKPSSLIKFQNYLLPSNILAIGLSETALNSYQSAMSRDSRFSHSPPIETKISKIFDLYLQSITCRPSSYRPSICKVSHPNFASWFFHTIFFSVNCTFLSIKAHSVAFCLHHGGWLSVLNYRKHRVTSPRIKAIYSDGRFQR